MKIYSFTCPIDVDAIDAFCCIAKGFTDQFVYYDKQHPTRFLGLGRCIALPTLDEAEYVDEGPVPHAPVFFSFARFDSSDPRPSDPLFTAFPRLQFMLPELVIIEDEDGTFLQVNSLGPLSMARADRFLMHIGNAPEHVSHDVPYTLEADSREDWHAMVDDVLARISAGTASKVVVSRRERIETDGTLDSLDLFENLVDGSSRGVVFLYRYGDVTFLGCTPELLVEKRSTSVRSMCLAGTTSAGADPQERLRLAEELLHDEKNLREHAHVVDHLRSVFSRTCYDVHIPASPQVMSLDFVQHLFTPVEGEVFEDCSLYELMEEIAPTPALSGYPVGEARRVLREVEPWNRGFFGGAVGYMDGAGDGEFSVAIRCGVFDPWGGYIYAGCGIVTGSDADSEYDETEMKFKTILSAFSRPRHHRFAPAYGEEGE